MTDDTIQPGSLRDRLRNLARCDDLPDGVVKVLREADETIGVLLRDGAQKAATIRAQDEALRFADEQGAEAIDRVSRSIVADKWNSTAEFQARAIKAEAALKETLLTLAADEVSR